MPIVEIIQNVPQVLNVVRTPVESLEVYLKRGEQGATGAPGLQPVFTMQGVLAPVTGSSRFYFDSTRTLTKFRAAVGTAPTGSGVSCSILVNGSVVGSVSIPAGSFTAVATLSQVVYSEDYLTVNVTSVGSVVVGSDLTVTVMVS